MDPDQTAPYCRRGSKKFVRGGCSKDLVFSYITIFYEGRRGCTNILSSLLVGQLMMASVIFFFFFFFFFGGGGGVSTPSPPLPHWIQACTGFKLFVMNSKILQQMTNLSTLVLKVLILNAPIATRVVCFFHLLKCLSSLYGKQCGPRSDCSNRSSLFWALAVCFYT